MLNKIRSNASTKKRPKKKKPVFIRIRIGNNVGALRLVYTVFL